MQRFRGRFQEAYPKSWPGRIYSKELYERLMDEYYRELGQETDRAEVFVPYEPEIGL
jgi:hypothetical protein